MNKEFGSTGFLKTRTTLSQSMRCWARSARRVRGLIRRKKGSVLLFERYDQKLSKRINMILLYIDIKRGQGSFGIKRSLRCSLEEKYKCLTAPLPRRLWLGPSAQANSWSTTTKKRIGVIVKIQFMQPAGANADELQGNANTLWAGATMKVQRPELVEQLCWRGRPADPRPVLFSQDPAHARRGRKCRQSDAAYGHSAAMISIAYVAHPPPPSEPTRPLAQEQRESACRRR